MTLILLLLVPVLAALVCLAARSRALWERVNLGAFAIVAALAFKTAGDVIAHGTVSAVAGFLRADALSALVERRAGELREDKISRSALASMLTELALQLSEDAGAASKPAKSAKAAG